MDLASEAVDDKAQYLLGSVSWDTSRRVVPKLKDEKSNEKIHEDFLPNLMRLNFCRQCLLGCSLFD